MKYSHAIFAYRMIDNIVVINDLWTEENCAKSVTNDVENVIEVINADLHGLEGYRVIYKDTQGIWDEIAIKDDQFFAFKSLNKKTLTEAMEVLSDRRKTKGS